jgi:RND family efflux transporter MFP subunit
MKLKFFTHFFAPALLLGGLGILSSGCSHGHAAESAVAPPPPAVTVAPVERREVVDQEEFTGRVEPVETVEIRPRVSGFIQEVKFQSGQLVKKGDVLFVIDPRWHKATFDQRQAEFEEARVRLENAGREAARTPQLLTNNAISVEESDARQSHYQEAKSALLAAEAARDFAQLDYEYTQVRAPIDGRVSHALLTDGNYVNGTAGGATLLTTIVSVDPVYVYADVDENILLKFNAANRANPQAADAGKVPVELQLGDEADFAHQGTIESFDNRLDAGTGSILLRSVFANPDGRIVPGLFARIRVPIGARHPALLVEERAIATDQAQKYVLTLTSSNTVAYQPVQLGGVIEGKRVIQSGLNGNEQIVVNGLARVRPGMAVSPEKETAAHTLAQR